MKIALIGYGKMGRIIETLAQEKGDEIILRIDETNANNLSEQLSVADVAIDFSNRKPSAEMSKRVWRQVFRLSKAQRVGMHKKKK